MSAEEKTGVWLGKGALDLGLHPPAQKPRPILAPDGEPTGARVQPAGLIVTERDFRRVLEGYAPNSSPFYGRPLNAYVRPNRRAAWDCVVSPHKSISVAALCTERADPELPRLVRTAFDLARGDLFAVMEARARHNNGHSPDVVTGTLLAAAFTHFTSRRNDPQLHTHLLLVNATRDYSPSSRRDWYALEPLPYYKQARVLDLVFQRELNRRLCEQGLDSRLMKVDGMPVAVLPAVHWHVCHRNSQAHQAIVALTKDRWRRGERTKEQKRQENVLNDRYRPSKVGQLAARAQHFERAVSHAEALAIVENVRLKPSGTCSPAKAPTVQSVEERIQEAFRVLKHGYITPGKMMLLACFASMGSPLSGIQPFIAAAARFKQEKEDLYLGGLQGHIARSRVVALAEEAAYIKQTDAERRRARQGNQAGQAKKIVKPAPSREEIPVTRSAASLPPALPERVPRKIPPPEDGKAPAPGAAAGPARTAPGSAPYPASAPPALRPTTATLPAYLREMEPEAPGRASQEQGQGPPRGP